MLRNWCRKIGLWSRRALLPALIVMLEAPVVLAGPEGGTVVGGAATISRPDAATTIINQASHNVAIDWDKFNIGANERVQFAQPGRSASALNRIFDQNPSRILGRLDANGRVVLLNPNGVFFGPNARVNVGALTAAGAKLGDDQLQAFLDSGRLKLQALDATDGLVVNQGLIEAATGGSVTLAGKAVRNEGVIIASAGRVSLVAGSAMTLDFDGDGLMRFAIDEGVLKNAHALDEAVANSGSITADGGEVLISAATARDVFDRAINNSGVVKAARIERSGGRIRLVGGGAGSSVLNTGTLSATGAGDTDGGSIHVLGDHVALGAGSVVDASGDAGGGEVLVGGDYQGA
ncbi:MAG: filamentous hemagglutinin N-terminal domain-containing protein, partial [Gammaproteobacteria bacterium]|nr:filamentous hemagglutinin N-terminal domain-containing protein [Gammaproteobacteria bacterium]